MEIKQIQDALHGQGVNATASQVQKFLADNGLTPEDVTESVVSAIASELKPSSAIAPVVSGKIAKGRNRTNTTRSQQATEKFGKAIAIATQVTGEEVEAIRTTVKATASNYAKSVAEELQGVIRDVPNMIVDEFAAIAQEEVGNAEYFLETTKSLFPATWTNLPSDAA